MRNYRDYIQPVDLRRIRAQRLTASIMQEITPLLKTDDDKYIHNAIYDLLWRTGADVITDMDRREAGLEDRGNTGYTAHELQILEAKRQEVMLSPIAPFIAEKTK